MVLAVPLGLSPVWVFSSAQHSLGFGPFGMVEHSDIYVPWGPIATFGLALPPIVGILTLISVRSAPVTPPRRAT